MRMRWVEIRRKVDNGQQIYRCWVEDQPGLRVGSMVEGQIQIGEQKLGQPAMWEVTFTGDYSVDRSEIGRGPA